MKRDKFVFFQIFFFTAHCLKPFWKSFRLETLCEFLCILYVVFVSWIFFLLVFKQSQILQSTLVWLSWGMSWACHMFHRLANLAGWNKCELRAIGLLICRLGVFGIFVLRSCPRGQQSLVVVPENLVWFFWILYFTI